MRPGEIALIRLPHTNGTPSKLRPVLVLANLPGRYNDVLVCGISAQLHLACSDWDEVISRQDEDFVRSGLHRSSVIRLSFLAATNISALSGIIGRVSPERIERLRHRLADHLLTKQ